MRPDTGDKPQEGSGQKPEMACWPVAYGGVRGEAGQEQGQMGRVGLGLGDCGPWKVSEQGWPGSERMGPEALSENHP